MIRPPSSSEAAPGAIDNRMIAIMRLVLASSALLIIYLDPTQPDRLVSLTYSALVLYTLYSLVLLIIIIHQRFLAGFIKNWCHWADVAWYLVLISLSSGTGSIFFFFFFFSILVASFRHGFVEGLKVTVVSAVLFSIIGYLTSTPAIFKLIDSPPVPNDLEFELNRFLLRPVYLMVIGYMMAYWGGHETTLRRRLALLKDITLLSNPRFGVDRTIGNVLEQVRSFYDADACALVMFDAETKQPRLRRADGRDPEAGMRSEPIDADLAELLLSLPLNYAVTFSSRSRTVLPVGSRYFVYDGVTGERRSEGEQKVNKIAGVLGAESLVMVPLRYRSEIIGRVFLTSSRKSEFDRSDADFLIHVIEQVIPVLDNIRLVDRLASDAADQERKRIARDLHDSVIQPYIGLQIGLASIRQKLDRGASDLRDDIARLYELTDMGISDLRRYVLGLKETGEHEGTLLPSVRRFAAKFGEATGIAVEVEARQNIRIKDRLAAEVFQMIIEGLSNIRRHTNARSATVRLGFVDSHLIIKIENERGSADNPTPFTPRSIADRAGALGGEAHVVLSDKTTAVAVEIPL